MVHPLAEMLAVALPCHIPGGGSRATMPTQVEKISFPVAEARRWFYLMSNVKYTIKIHPTLNQLSIVNFVSSELLIFTHPVKSFGNKSVQVSMSQLHMYRKIKPLMTLQISYTPPLEKRVNTNGSFMLMP